MTTHRFRGKTVESLSRDELIVLIKWLMDRLEQKRNDPLDALRRIWNDNE